jgi:iron-sulfur cluster assembly protein
MFNIPGSTPITITTNAVNQIKLLAKKDKKLALRIGLKKGGCAGMEYTMDFVESVESADELIEVDGAKVVIAATAQMFLFGTQIDYVNGILESGFKFNNPNVSESCGCGESIKFSD